MALERMDNVGIVVDDLTATIDFFLELGLELSRFLTPTPVADHRNAPVNATPPVQNDGMVADGYLLG